MLVHFKFLEDELMPVENLLDLVLAGDYCALLVEVLECKRPVKVPESSDLELAPATQVRDHLEVKFEVV